MVNRNDHPTDEQDEHTENDPVLNRRRVLQLAGSGIVGTSLLAAQSNAQESPDRLEIVAARGETVDYTFEVEGAVSHVSGSSFTAANPGSDVISESDGVTTVDGSTADGYGDAFELDGPVRTFEPSDGPYTLYLNGDRVSHSDLVEPVAKREHSYSFENHGQEWADYYLEVQDDGDMFASTLDGATVDPEFHWVSEDGTKAAGRVHAGDRHAYEFDNLVLDVTIEGPGEGGVTAFVDGRKSSIDRYPQDGATGDGWKGGFPWQTVEEEQGEREHSYSFENHGDEWADYYLEVQDGGDMYASTLDGATIDPEFHWVSEDGTKAAGRVHPEDRHAHEFDNLVLDVTIEGPGESGVEAFVDGRESSLHIYPQDGATGDGWKGGFPWQDEEEETQTENPDGVALGGGPGYENIVTESEADYVVSNASDLESALRSASSGDVVFVPGNARIDTGGRSMDVPRGVTLASNRGLDGSSGALLHTEETPQIMLRPQYKSRITGLRLRGHSPDRTVTHSDGISFDTPTYAMQLEGGSVEVDNCQIWGWPDRAVYVRRSGAHIHHNYIYDNNGQGLGYGVAANEECLIEYNYFHNNRHSVTCAYDAPGYTARYNHFSPKSVMHIVDIHDPFRGDTTIEGNIIENGESRTWDNPDAEGIAGYSGGFDGGSLSVLDNWFFDESSAYFDSFSEVSDSGNVYGDEGSHNPADVIPNHPGLSTRPWA